MTKPKNRTLKPGIINGYTHFRSSKEYKRIFGNCIDAGLTVLQADIIASSFTEPIETLPKPRRLPRWPEVPEHRPTALDE